MKIVNKDNLTQSINFKISRLDYLQAVCGSNSEHISVIEKLLGSPIFIKGNELQFISDSERALEDFKNLCNSLIDALNQQIEITPQFIHMLYVQLTGAEKAAEKSDTQSFQNTKIRKEHEEGSPQVEISMITVPITEKKIVARTQGQREIIDSLKNHLLSFLVGPAGTGKTYFATAYALQQLLSKKKEKYIITRPVVEAGEKLGFLPGDLEQKIFPYLKPIYDALHEIAGESIIAELQERTQIEIAPLAYMRGRTLKNSVVLLDEAQNCTPAQMRMFLTRLGEGSIAIVNGDLSQSDIPKRNGLEEAIMIFNGIKDINIVQLSYRDVQRSKLAKIVIKAYDDYSKKK